MSSEINSEEVNSEGGTSEVGKEDSQSNCSKNSSGLTPSENRSNEEMGSSLKESDASGMPYCPAIACF